MQQYIIGNWKMNGTKADAVHLASALVERLQKATRALPHIVVCPSYPYLLTVGDILESTVIALGSQDSYPEPSGAYTGDVSITQLKDVGCKYVIIGHNERRQHHFESSILIRRKVEAALKAGLHPIVCIGESLEQREKGQTLSFIAHQLKTDLPEDLSSHLLLIAYEPLWAIGTGKTPTSEQVEEVLGLIKHELSDRLAGGAIIPTLYGGSVTPQNVSEFINLPHVDGLLIGGPSLKIDDFWTIVNASER